MLPAGGGLPDPFPIAPSREGEIPAGTTAPIAPFQGMTTAPISPPLPNRVWEGRVAGLQLPSCPQAIVFRTPCLWLPEGTTASIAPTQGDGTTTAPIIPFLFLTESALAGLQFPSSPRAVIFWTPGPSFPAFPIARCWGGVGSGVVLLALTREGDSADYRLHRCRSSECDDYSAHRPLPSS